MYRQNCFGQVMRSENWTGNKIQIDFLPRGYYIIQIKKEATIIGVMKLIKK